MPGSFGRRKLDYHRPPGACNVLRTRSQPFHSRPSPRVERETWLGVHYATKVPPLSHNVVCRAGSRGERVLINSARRTRSHHLTRSFSQVSSVEARAHDVLRSITSLRNLLQPINRLPPETLSQIAQYVLGPSARDVVEIIPLTHVCRYWRASIISFPGNWTLISSRDMRLTTLCLERSRAAPLKIWLDMNQVKRQPRFSDLIIPRIQSAMSLEFSELMTPEDLMKTLPNFPQSMPNLQSLDVSLSVHAPNWNPSINPFNPFPHTLKCPFLYDIPLYPPILNLRTLTKLLLHNFNFNHSLDMLLTFLEENCSLVDVILRIDSSNPILYRSP